MKLGVFTALFADRSLDDVLALAKENGLSCVELGTGNYPGSPHVPVKKLLGNIKARTEFLAKFGHFGIEISALSCHGNPLHPSKKIARAHHDIWRETVKLARMLNVDTVIVFSGCPGDHDRARRPNWITCPWPPDYPEVLAWQWEKCVMPYWKTEAKFARQHGIKVAVEAHPGFVVYNTESILKLREAAGDNVGVNFDPSHFFWQGMDPLVALNALRECIYHVHAKDTLLDPRNTAVNGVLDNTPYGQVDKRSWIFRTVGYGHDEKWWKDFISTLRTVGYDGVISIEHEDALMSIDQGFQRAVRLLRSILLTDPPPQTWWT